MASKQTEMEQNIFTPRYFEQEKFTVGNAHLPWEKIYSHLLKIPFQYFLKESPF